MIPTKKFCVNCKYCDKRYPFNYPGKEDSSIWMCNSTHTMNVDIVSGEHKREYCRVIRIRMPDCEYYDPA